MWHFNIIIGGIYGGLFTATEAAAISAFAVIVIGSIQKTYLVEIYLIN